jgi:hypothetical protein
MLFFTCAAPLWWALVDVAARLAGAQAPQSSNLILGLGNSAMPIVWSTMITVLGTLVIPIATGIVVFRRFNAIGHLWRGAL